MMVSLADVKRIVQEEMPEKPPHCLKLDEYVAFQVRAALEQVLEKIEINVEGGAE
jgi:hypothetical protein